MLDLTLPVILDSAWTDAGLVGTSIAAAVVRAPSAGRAGSIAVRVPDVLPSGSAFSFPLPDALMEAAKDHEVSVTLKNGRPLPSWLRYAPASRTFFASGTSTDELPIQVLVRIGEQSWIVTITHPQGS